MDSGNIQKVKVTICQSYFNREKRVDHEFDYAENMSVFSLVEYLHSLIGLRFIPSISGKVVKKDYCLQPGDQLVLVPNLYDSDRLFNPFSSGHDPWEAIKGTFSFANNGGSVWDQALDAARWNVQHLPGIGAIADWHEQLAKDNPWMVTVAATFAGAWTYGVGAWAVRYIADRYGITPKGEAPAIPGVGRVPTVSGGGGGMGGGGGGGGGFTSSNSYAWNPQTMSQIGAMIPRIYGTFMSKGNIISSNISVVESGTHPGDQVLNSLLLLCQGPVSGISDVTINNKPLSNFTNVTIDYRYGDPNQTVIPNFNDTTRTFSFSYKLETNVYTTYITEDNDFDAIKVTITFPYGLYVTETTRTELHYQDIYIDWPQPPDYKTTKKTLIGQKYLGQTTYGGNTVAYTVNLTLQYRKVGDTAWSNYGSTGAIAVTECKTSAFNKSYKLDNLERGNQYEIRITRTNTDQESPFVDDVYFTGVTEIIKDDFKYPTLVLVGLTALATNQLSGSLDFQCSVDGSICRVWDGSQWTAQWTDNPAWVAYDILTQPVFGAGVQALCANKASTTSFTVSRYDGVDPSDVDTASFYAWAQFCDEYVSVGGRVSKYSSDPSYYERRFRFNGVFDVATSQWDALMEVCNMARGMVYIKGYKYYAVHDTSGTPTQMFTSGNIIADSFKESFLSISNRATEMEVDFANEENDYKRETVTIVDPNAVTPKQLSTNQLLGCTSITQAWRTGRYKLYNNQYVIRFIEFSADIDAIACSVGDLIYFAHDLPQWGFSGRVVSSTSDTVTLDRTVTLTEGVTYAIRIRLSDDTIVYKTTTGSGDLSTLTVSTFTTEPAEFDPYTFGVAGVEYKPFRVTKIQPNEDLTFTIEASEYNASIYNCDTDTPAYPTPNYSSLDILPQVTNIVLDEIVTKTKDGLIVNNIDVYWDIPQEFSYSFAEVWYKSSNMYHYQSAGVCYADRLRISNLPLTEGPVTYTVVVQSVNSVGMRLHIDDSPSETIYVVGMADAPSSVTVFDAHQIDQDIRFDWGHIEDADLAGYEIRMGAAWDSGTVIGSGITDNYFYYKPEISGTYQFFISAIDTTSHYSSTPKSVTITVYNITPTLNIIYDVDEIATGALGTKFNFTLGSAENLCSEAESLVFTTAAGTGYYISNVVDMLKTGLKTVRLIDDIDSTEDATDLTFPDRTDMTYPDDTDLHVTSEYYKYLAFRYSDTTGESGMVSDSYLPYYGPASVNGRYFQFGINIVVPSQTALLNICSFRTIVDVPESSYKIPALAIPSAGTGIVYADYGLTFYATPTVGCSVLNSRIALVPYIYDESATGFSIKLIDIVGAATAGTGDIQIFGY